MVTPRGPRSTYTARELFVALVIPLCLVAALAYAYLT
jgi:hypothetical protein